MATPGAAGSARLTAAQAPVPGPGEVLVRVLRIGVDGTDREIDQGLYGEAPPGSRELVLGHEALGVVEESRAPGFRAGDLVVPTVRRPCPENCASCRNSESDMCYTGHYTERGIKGRHGYMAEFFAEVPDFLVPIPPALRDAGVLLEPLSIVVKALGAAWRVQERLRWEPRRALVLGSGSIGLLATFLLRLRGVETTVVATHGADNPKAKLAEDLGATYVSARETPVRELGRSASWDLILEATGNSAVAMDAMFSIGTNGVLCLTGVSGGNRSLEIKADALNLELVLGNKAVFGSVNSNRGHFLRGMKDLEAIRGRWPGPLGRMFTRALPLERFREGFARPPDDIKTVLLPGS